MKPGTVHFLLLPLAGAGPPLLLLLLACVRGAHIYLPRLRQVGKRGHCVLHLESVRIYDSLACSSLQGGPGCMHTQTAVAVSGWL